jgi:hypothetical protein
MTKEQLKNFVKVATGHARVVHSRPRTEQEQSIAMAVVRNRAIWNKMSPSQKRAAILRGLPLKIRNQCH